MRLPFQSRLLNERSHLPSHDPRQGFDPIFFILPAVSIVELNDREAAAWLVIDSGAYIRPMTRRLIQNWSRKAGQI